MECRPGCAACCVYISISSPIPGMAAGKPAGIRCVNLQPSGLCAVYGTAHYPAVCRNFKPSREMCGDDATHARDYLVNLERLTQPNDAD